MVTGIRTKFALDSLKEERMKDDILVCFSGGLDTTLITLKYLNSGGSVIPFWVDYNQWEVREQTKSMERVLDWLSPRGHLHPLVKVKAELPGGPIGHSSGRILMSLGLAVMYADRVGSIRIIATGYRGISHYPESAEPMQILMRQSLEKLGYIYQTPLLGMSKSQIGKELAMYNVPWRLMDSCYWSPPCGTKSENDTYLCGGCRNKVEAMRAAGVTNPELLRRPNVNP